MFSACKAAWPRRPERRELSVIKIRSSMPPAAYQRLDANPTIHMQMRFLGSTVKRKGDDLLRRPRCGRVFRNIEMQNTSTVMGQDDKDVQHTKLYGRNGEEVDRNHLSDVISQECHPRLRWLSRLLGHPARHRPFRDREPQF